MVFAGIVYGAESVGVMKNNEKVISSLNEKMEAKDEAIKTVLAEKEKVMIAKIEAIEKVAAAEKRELETKIDSMKNEKRRVWFWG